MIRHMHSAISVLKPNIVTKLIEFFLNYEFYHSNKGKMEYFHHHRRITTGLCVRFVNHAQSFLQIHQELSMSF